MLFNYCLAAWPRPALSITPHHDLANSIHQTFTTYPNVEGLSSDADSLYSSWVKVLTMCQKVKGDFVAILEPDIGYARRMN